MQRCRLCATENNFFLHIEQFLDESCRKLTSATTGENKDWTYLLWIFQKPYLGYWYECSKHFQLLKMLNLNKPLKSYFLFWDSEASLPPTFSLRHVSGELFPTLSGSREHLDSQRDLQGFLRHFMSRLFNAVFRLYWSKRTFFCVPFNTKPKLSSQNFYLSQKCWKSLF